MLMDQEIQSPVYYIIGGANPGEGAIITRDYDDTANVDFLDADNGKWFLV